MALGCVFHLNITEAVLLQEKKREWLTEKEGWDFQTAGSKLTLRRFD
jgi:hypothetical protein